MERRVVALMCEGINAHDMISICPVCFLDEMAAREAAQRYGVMRHSSMEELLARLASDDD